MEPGCTAHMGAHMGPIWVPYRLLAGNEKKRKEKKLTSLGIEPRTPCKTLIKSWT